MPDALNQSKRQSLERLAKTIRGLERASQELRRTALPTPFIGLNRVLPGGGLPLGSMIEILADPGGGGFSFALTLARAHAEKFSAWAVVDGERSFYAPAAAAWNFDLHKLILVRAEARHLPWVASQLLRCPDIGAVFFEAAKLDNMSCRRLQLAAERGGNFGFVLRPLKAQTRPCWATVRLKVTRPGEGSIRDALEIEDQPGRWAVSLLHAKG